MKDAILCDLDGTLANCEHRRHFLEGGSPNFDAFFENMDQDEVVRPIAQLLDIYRDKGISILLCSNRPEKYRDKTDKWLLDNKIFYDYLFLRLIEHENSPDQVSKKALLDHKISPL